jgi:hypothetical protein
MREIPCPTKIISVLKEARGRGERQAQYKEREKERRRPLGK